MLDRRTFLATGVLAAALLGHGLPALAATASAGSVRVDVSALRAQGLGPNADYIQAALQRDLAGAAPPGTTLVVTVRSIFMPSYAGNGGMFGGDDSQDTMDTEVQVIGAGGRVIASYPILSSSSPSSAGPWYVPNIDRLRLDAMASTNAQWVRRYVGS